MIRLNARHRTRLAIALLFLLGIAAATALALMALRENIAYFRTPSEVMAGTYPEAASGRAFRLGGMVEKESLTRQGHILTFRVTDMHNSVTVRFDGIPPDLFREGQGVVAEGKMAPGGTYFTATRLLAKHDENYMPPELKGVLTTPASPIP